MTDQPVKDPGKKPIWTRWWMILLYVLVGLGVIGSLAGDETDDVDAPGLATATTETGSSDTTLLEATTTTEQATTTTVEATTTTQFTTTTEPQTVQPDPVEFSGSGNDVIEFGADLAWLSETFGVFDYQVSGSGNNAVWALDNDFEPTDLLVNTIGDQTGTRFISLTDDAVGLDVEVGGAWTFTISPPTNLFPPKAAEDFNVPVIDTTGTYQGAETEAINWEGPSVIALKTEGRIAEITARGDGNIAIWAYSTNGDVELLVNEIGEFDGSARLPDCSEGCWLDIDGDMTYSLSIRS